MPYPSHKPPAEREARALLAWLSTADKLDLRRQLGGGGVREPFLSLAGSLSAPGPDDNPTHHNLANSGDQALATSEASGEP